MSAIRLIRPLGLNLRCQSSKQLLRNQDFPRVLCAFISSKENMGDYQRPPPFPYKEKKYTWYHHWFDRAVDRMNENSKILVVDGPIAAGKSTLAKELAEQLDMLYIPEANLDMSYINKYGFDLRSLNPKLPPTAQYIDVKHFYRDPKHPNVGPMQVEIQELRFRQYIDALAHLLHTGQGVILDRSVYSDFVFMQAMYESGYLSKGAKIFYEEADIAIKLQLKQPHLIIYLDVPVSVVKERIKKRNIDWEVNSSVLTDKYLSSIEKHYKEKFLRDMSVKSELLVYDWSNYGDVEVVVEDIERLDFTIDKYGKKFEDWRVNFDREYQYWRWDYTNEKEDMVDRTDPAVLIPEMLLTHEEAELRMKLLDEVPGGYYSEGYNPDQGDRVLFKWK